MKYLIIIPTYNEIENIGKIVGSINSTLKDNYDYSILIIDDSSTDGTKEAIEELKNYYKNVLTHHRKGKLGLASAYITGIKKGIELGYDCFVELDADFSHHPKYLPTMFEKLKNNDVVIGSRNINGGKSVGWGLIRTLVSKGGSLYSKLILNCPINDLTGGFNGWRREIIEKIDLDKIISKGYSFQIEMKYRAYKKGAKIEEFPIIFIDRRFGKSKMSKAIFLEAMLNIIKIKFMEL